MCSLIIDGEADSLSEPVPIINNAGRGKLVSVRTLREATTAAFVALAAAAVVAVPRANAIVLLPKTPEQVEASASRARAMSALPTYPLLEAQRNIDKLLEDQDAFRTCVTLGLPTGRLQMPTVLENGFFLNLELSATDPKALRAAAEVYTIDAAKANEYLTYAEAAQIDSDAAATKQNLDLAFSAVDRCKASLMQVLAQLPASMR